MQCLPAFVLLLLLFNCNMQWSWFLGCGAKFFYFIYWLVSQPAAHSNSVFYCENGCIQMVCMRALYFTVAEPMLLILKCPNGSACVYLYIVNYITYLLVHMHYVSYHTYLNCEVKFSLIEVGHVPNLQFGWTHTRPLTSLYADFVTYFLFAKRQPERFLLPRAILSTNNGFMKMSFIFKRKL